MFELQRVLVTILCVLVGLVALTTFQTLGQEHTCLPDGTPQHPASPR